LLNRIAVFCGATISSGAFGNPTWISVRVSAVSYRITGRSHGQLTIDLGVRYALNVSPQGSMTTRTTSSPRIWFRLGAHRLTGLVGIGISFDRYVLRPIKRGLEKNKGRRASSKWQLADSAVKFFTMAPGGSCCTCRQGSLPRVPTRSRGNPYSNSKCWCGILLAEQSHLARCRSLCSWTQIATDETLNLLPLLS